MVQPPIGWTTPARLIRVKDGDTIEIEIYRRISIRIINDTVYFDTPEIFKPSCPEEKVQGLRYKKKLEELLMKPVIVREKEYVPIVAIVDGAAQTVYTPKMVTKSVLEQREIVIHIPQNHDCKFSTISQLSRIGGMVFADGVDVTEELLKLEQET